MATIINADTSNGLKLTSDTSGEIQLQSAGTTIATVDSSGITMASGKTLTTNAPAFSATPSADQTLSSATWTTMAFNTEDFDTNNNYNTSTYAFTPTVAGYYNFTATIRSTGATTRFYTKFVKNDGAANYFGNDFNFSATSLNSNFSALIYMNGSTDSVVAQAFMQGSGGLNTQANIMRYSAFLARAS